MAMLNTMALLDRKSDGWGFIDFKALLRQSFPYPSTHSTFAARSFDQQNPSGRSRDPKKGRENSRPRWNEPHRGDSNSYKSPNGFNRKRRGSGSRDRDSRSNSRQLRGRNDSGANRSGLTSISFHTSSPNILACIIDTGARQPCICQKAFMYMAGNPGTLSKSTHTYIFSDGEPSPSIDMTDICSVWNHEISMDVVWM